MLWIPTIQSCALASLPTEDDSAAFSPLIVMRPAARLRYPSASRRSMLHLWLLEHHQPCVLARGRRILCP